MGNGKQSALVRAELEESIEVKRALVAGHVDSIVAIAAAVIAALRGGHKVLIFGNGGSAADAQHIAAELAGRFRRERRAMPAVALTTDTSILTAVANDYSYETVFARQVEALGQAGDIALGISTSGNSGNVVEALRQARQQGLITVGFTGQSGGRLLDVTDHCLCVPSQDTARIQESHIAAAHAVCEVVERELTGVL